MVSPRDRKRDSETERERERERERESERETIRPTSIRVNRYTLSHIKEENRTRTYQMGSALASGDRRCLAENKMFFK